MSMINYKTCSKCGVEKPVTEFGDASPTSDGYNSWCKQCVRDSSKRYRETPKGLYSALKGRVKWTKKNETRFYKPLLMERDEFIGWYINEPKICCYCDLPEEHLWAMQEDFDRRVLRLEFECKDNDRGYSLDNIALACHRCNFIKNNILTYDEMREFAQKYLKSRWLEKVNNRPTKIKEE